MTAARDPARSVPMYVSAGSAGGRHLQAGMGGMAIGIWRPAPPRKGWTGRAPSRTSRLAGGEFHQLDGLRIDDRTAEPLGCIEMHKGLVAERIAQDARLTADGDQVNGAEIAECDRQAVRPPDRHI